MKELFQKFKNDWLPAEFIFPTYSGPRNLLALEFRNSNAEIALRAHRKAYQRIQYLKRKDWIQTKKTETGLLIALTDEGKVEKMRRCVETRRLLPNDRVCLVIFDVPEIASRGRREFRQFLKRLGFVMTQLSVWQSDRDLAEDVVAFIKQAKIAKWTAVYIAQRKC